MCRLLETIKIDQGKIFNLSYHQKRFNHAQKHHFGLTVHPDLADFIKPPDELAGHTIKCRIIYHQQIEKIEYLPYHPRHISSLKIVFADQIDYSFKWKDRQALDLLLQQKGNCDDIVIIKNGLITDSSFANLVFYDKTKWITPAQPLLKGTKRAQLLDQEIISEAEIKIADLKFFKKAGLINAMLNFENDQPGIKIENIIF